MCLLFYDPHFILCYATNLMMPDWVCCLNFMCLFLNFSKHCENVSCTRIIFYVGFGFTWGSSTCLGLLLTPKECGGLGILDLEIMNSALKLC